MSIPEPSGITPSSSLSSSQDINPETKLASTETTDGNLFIASIAELREKANDVYKATLKSFAETIMREMKRAQERLKRANRQ